MPRIEIDDHHANQDHQPEPGRLGDRDRAPRLDSRGERPRQQDVVDRGLGGGGGDQLEQRRQREAQERQRDRLPMTFEDPYSSRYKTGSDRCVPAPGSVFGEPLLAPEWGQMLRPAAPCPGPASPDPFSISSQVFPEPQAAADPSVK